jgi:hypothetical protein
MGGFQTSGTALSQQNLAGINSMVKPRSLTKAGNIRYKNGIVC